MRKNGFVLMETIVVIVVISIALLTIFTSYNKILSKIKSENKYDNSEYIYMTKHIKNFLKENNCAKNSNEIIYEMGKKDNTLDPNRKKVLKDYFASTSGCNFGSNPFGIKKIYILKYLNEIDEDEDNPDLQKFDGYMIDYIRKLDVGDNDTVIIVEFKKDAKNDKGGLKKDSLDNQLTETYIASLEWN